MGNWQSILLDLVKLIVPLVLKWFSTNKKTICTTEPPVLDYSPSTPVKPKILDAVDDSLTYDYTKPFYFGANSKKNLAGVHPKLAAIAEKALSLSTVDFSIIDGVRTIEEQRKYFAQGASRTMKSKHLIQPDGFAHAIDIGIIENGVYLKGNTQDDQRKYYLVKDAFMQAAKVLGVSITWGGQFRDLVDLGHFELDK